MKNETKNTRTYLSTDQQKEVCNLYLNEFKTTREIAEIFNCSKGYIKNILERYEFQLRRPLNCRIKNKFNRDFFKVIDTEAKAYFLGLLYADGSNSGSVITISLQEEDGYILEKLKECINHTYDLYFWKSPNPNWKNKVKLSIGSVNLANDLIKLGCIPRKSLVLKFPTEDQVPNHLIHHFIRGYFDGDGCISYRKRKTPIKNKDKHIGQFSFTSSRFFIEKLREILNNIDIKTTLTKRFSDCEAYTLLSAGWRKIYRLHKFLYKDATIFLTRKKDKIEEYLDNIGIDNEGRESHKESKYRGVTAVSYIRKDGTHKWQSSIQHQKKIYFLGCFETEIEAAQAYDRKSIEIFGENADLNFSKLI